MSQQNKLTKCQETKYFTPIFFIKTEKRLSAVWTRVSEDEVNLLVKHSSFKLDSNWIRTTRTVLVHSHIWSGPNESSVHRVTYIFCQHVICTDRRCERTDSLNILNTVVTNKHYSVIILTDPKRHSRVEPLCTRDILTGRSGGRKHTSLSDHFFSDWRNIVQTSICLHKKTTEIYINVNMTADLYMRDTERRGRRWGRRWGRWWGRDDGETRERRGRDEGEQQK